MNPYANNLDNSVDDLYVNRELTSSKSKIHKNHEDITFGEVMSRFNDIDFDYNDYETCIDMANIITHIKNNGTIDDAKTGVDDDKIDELGSFINSCTGDILKKGSPLQIASTILKLVVDPEKDNLNKEQLKEMVENAIEKENNEEQEENNEQEQGDQGEKQEDDGEDGEQDGDGKEGSGDSDKDGDDGDKQEGKGNGNGEGEEESKEPQKSSGKTASKSGQTPLLERLKTYAKDARKEISKYVEVKEKSDTYGIPMDDILDYKNLKDKELEFLRKLSIIESRGKLKASKFVPKENTDMMNEYSQVSKLRNKTEMLMPTFDYKFATKNLIVKRNTYPTKQALCLMIDDSGSMHEVYKMDWVKAILWNRAVESEKKNIDLYVALFEGSVYEFTKINNLDEAKEFYTRISFGGGGTDIQKCATFLMNKFKRESINAQIVVINDGQDYVHPTWEPSQELHAIMLGNGNDHLQTVIKKKDGHFEIFKHNS